MVEQKELGDRTGNGTGNGAKEIPRDSARREITWFLNHRRSKISERIAGKRRVGIYPSRKRYIPDARVCIAKCMY